MASSLLHRARPPSPFCRKDSRAMTKHSGTGMPAKNSCMRSCRTSVASFPATPQALDCSPSGPGALSLSLLKPWPGLRRSRRQLPSGSIWRRLFLKYGLPMCARSAAWRFASVCLARSSPRAQASAGSPCTAPCPYDRRQAPLRPTPRVPQCGWLRTSRQTPLGLGGLAHRPSIRSPCAQSCYAEAGGTTATRLLTLLHDRRYAASCPSSKCLCRRPRPICTAPSSVRLLDVPPECHR